MNELLSVAVVVALVATSMAMIAFTVIAALMPHDAEALGGEEATPKPEVWVPEMLTFFEECSEKHYLKDMPSELADPSYMTGRGL